MSALSKKKKRKRNKHKRKALHKKAHHLIKKHHVPLIALVSWLIPSPLSK